VQALQIPLYEARLGRDTKSGSLPYQSYSIGGEGMKREITEELFEARVKESLNTGMKFMHDVIIRRVEKSDLPNKEEVKKVIVGYV
jgi:hypothetical protein